MILEVDVFSHLSDKPDNKIGTIRWDGEKLTCDPVDSVRLNNMIDGAPFYEPRIKKLGKIDPKTDPVDFMHALPYFYRAGYSWTSDVRSVHPGPAVTT